jgi:hypothetical protein
MMELKDLANFGSFGVLPRMAVKEYDRQKGKDEEEKRRMEEQAAAEQVAAQGGMKKGGKVKKMAKGGSVGSASKRADGIASRGKTRGRMV